jgi:CRISPR-associated protein Cas1
LKGNLRALPKFRDGLSFVYIEYAVVEKEDHSLVVFREAGRISLPVASIGCLLLGPGTRVTHAAMAVLGEAGSSVAWVGETGVRFYAGGTGKSRSSRNLEVQARAFADPQRHMAVVRRLYSRRFLEALPEGLTLQQIRGREGVRVRETYAAASKLYGVEWNGRSYKQDSWANADPVNRALSAGNACLYGICHAALLATGFSPGLGFIHVGRSLSFVYDVADLYKAEIVIPAAFEATATAGKPEALVRKLVRQRISEGKLLGRMVRDLGWLFEIEDVDSSAFGGDGPGELWDLGSTVPGGVSHAGDAH